MRDEERIDLYYRSGLLDWRSETALTNKKNDKYGPAKLITRITTLLRNLIINSSKSIINKNNECNDVITIVSRIESKLDRIDMRLVKLEKRNKSY